MDKAYDFLFNELGIKYGDAVVVACSGGPDSMALLHMLYRLKKALDIEVVCAQVNHNTGRNGQAEEQEFVKAYCRNHGLTFEGMTIEDYGDDNFHNEARTKRYSYFGEVVKKYKAKYLFTAHHGDDLTETILMRIVRGSTLRGYSGFSKIVDMGTYKIVRPLIEVSKDDILSYDKKNRVPFREDSSNTKDVYTRNRFRKYIVPQFKKEDKHVNAKFYKFSKTLLEYNEYIDKQMKRCLSKVYPQNVLNIEEFEKLDRVIAMKIIYYMLEQKYQDDLMLITDHHAELIYQLINSNRANVSIHLPNNIKAVKSYNTLTLTNEDVSPNEYEIEIIKYVNLPNGKNIEVVDKSKLTDNNVIRLSSDEVCLPLHVRSRRNGDKIYIKGMLGSKKVKDIFIDEKINQSERDLWPVVVDSKNNIVWLPGLKKSKFDKKIDDKYDIILKYY